METGDDFVNAFFNFGSLPRSIAIPRPQIVAEVRTEPDISIEVKREDRGIEYARRYRVKEEQLLATQTLNQPTSSTIVLDSDDEDCVETAIEDPELPELTVFQRYEFNLNPQKLPILEKREDILNIISSNYVVVMQANTGTGKSSQVPQYILEEAYKKKENCNIIVTQPRRVGAITIAKRVALERRCDCGSLVGYQVGLDKQMDTRANPDTRILFCTTGVLLQRLINEKTMKRYTHVILDEIHERDVQMDMLLIVVRRLLATRNPRVKIILMSATLNSAKIADFFKFHKSSGQYGPAPILDLNVPRPFPVRISYLNDLARLGATDDMVDITKPGISKTMYALALKVMELVLEKAKGKLNPSFLVFLPGIHEINCFKDYLYEPSKTFNISLFQLSILHSSIPESEYARAFDGSVENKIILATNIAESSVTLPGVRFVIDFCLTKYQLTDTATNMSQLTLDWASKMNLEQRAGRVGRIEAGQVVRLLFEHQFESLQTESIPEMERVSLESVVLQAKQLEMGKPSNVLALALDPPSRSAVLDSILVLKEIGGLTRLNKRGKFDENDGELTFAGKVMARLPLDVRISKLILLGYMFSCKEECIIIGAGMSTRSIFKSVSSKKMEEYQEKLEQAKGSGSDHIAILNAYREWRNMVVEKQLTGAREKKWCELKMLSLKNLNEMNNLIQEIKNRLKWLKLDDNYRYSTEEKLFAIKICIGGAFHPNYFAFGGKPPSRDDYSVLNNMNPCSTVFLKGMPQNRLGQIYESQIRQKLCEKGVTETPNDMNVKFDEHSTRVQVQFKPISDEGFVIVPGEVLLEVYKAVKYRKLEKNMEINTMDPKYETVYASEIDLGRWKMGRFEIHKKFLSAKASKHSIFPYDLQVESIYGEITHIVNCGKFFFRPEQGKENVEKQRQIFQKCCVKITSLDNAVNGLLLIVNHNELFKRGKIVEFPEGEEEVEFSVYLIDYGSVIKSVIDDFYMCNEDLMRGIFDFPPQCFQCRLSELIPSPIKCPSGWSGKSTEVFHKFIENKKLKINVNSFVDRVASVVLYSNCSTTGTTKRLDEELILRNYAQTSDDSYLCLLNQSTRETLRKTGNDRQEPLQDELVGDKVSPPPEHLLVKETTIDGPHSPLQLNVENLSRTEHIDVVMEPSSVNHVLFDPFPNDGVKKLLVATTMSKRDTRVTLHNSTIMPHLPGMACLMGLIFSPIAEVRLSKRKNRYTSILTGLGCDENRKPFYGEHDCLIYVDVELDKADFEMIDSLRRKMSFLMQTGIKIEYSRRNQDETVRNQICGLLLRIAKKSRSQMGLNMEESGWNWRPIVKIEQKVDEMYPALVTVEELKPMSAKSLQDLRNHANELQRLAAVNAKNETIICQLCEERLENVVDLKLHIMKKLHKDRVVKIREVIM